MSFKRYLIEIGQGVDMHGGDNTNAAVKAVRDAMHHCCMAGIIDIFQISDIGSNLKVDADLYVPAPEQLDTGRIKEELSAYESDIKVHKGGASAKGLYKPDMGEGDHITIALAVLTVYVNVSPEGGNQ